jgi:hypothetical protein
MAAIDRFTPIKILDLGLLFSAAHLKNAPLTIAAGASISSAGLPVPQQIGTLAFFVVIAPLGVLAPLAVHLVMGERAKSVLVLQPRIFVMRAVVVGWSPRAEVGG